MRIGLESDVDTYAVPMVPDSDLLPLLGIRTLEGRQAIVNCSKHCLILPGPGSVHHPAEPRFFSLFARKGFIGSLDLPTNKFPKQGEGKRAPDEQLALATSRSLA